MKKNQKDIIEYKEDKVYRGQEDVVNTISRKSSLEREDMSPVGQHRSPCLPPWHREADTNGMRENCPNSKNIVRNYDRGGGMKEESRRPKSSPPQYRVPTENRYLPLVENTPLRQGDYAHYSQEASGNGYAYYGGNGENYRDRPYHRLQRPTLL